LPASSINKTTRRFNYQCSSQRLDFDFDDPLCVWATRNKTILSFSFGLGVFGLFMRYMPKHKAKFEYLTWRIRLTCVSVANVAPNRSSHASFWGFKYRKKYV